jgi:uncharacterized phage protein gp47/JayE
MLGTAKGNMTTYGLTSTGCVIKTRTAILGDIETWQRDKISSKLDMSEKTILGAANAQVADQLAEGWQTLKDAAGVLDPNTAVEMLLVALCKLTGVVRAGATKGKVAGVQLTCKGGTTIPAGTLTLAVFNEAANLWINDTTITAATDSVQTCSFTSAQPGSAAVASAGTLTVIATPITGLLSATNPIEAEQGTDLQSLDDLRLAREESLAATGKGTVAAVTAALAGPNKVPGVIDVRVVENDTSATVDGIPPGAIRVVVWDGSGLAATNADIAAAIYAAKGDGTPTFGATTQTTPDPWGALKPMHFDRATAMPIYITLTVSGSTTADIVKAAIVAAHREVIDNDVLYAALLSAAFNAAGVTNVSLLKVGTAPAPTGVTDVAIDSDAVGVLGASRIAVTLI